MVHLVINKNKYVRISIYIFSVLYICAIVVHTHARANIYIYIYICILIVITRVGKRKEKTFYSHNRKNVYPTPGPRRTYKYYSRRKLYDLTTAHVCLKRMRLLYRSVHIHTARVYLFKFQLPIQHIHTHARARLYSTVVSCV